MVTSCNHASSRCHILSRASREQIAEMIASLAFFWNFRVFVIPLVTRMTIRSLVIAPRRGTAWSPTSGTRDLSPATSGISWGNDQGVGHAGIGRQGQDAQRKLHRQLHQQALDQVDWGLRTNMRYLMKRLMMNCHPRWRPRPAISCYKMSRHQYRHWYHHQDRSYQSDVSSAKKAN